METKRAVCTVCDIACQLHVDVEEGRVLRVTPPDNPIVADNFCLHRRPGFIALAFCYSGGAAGNRTRVLRHSLKTSPCAVRYASTWISCSREQVRMTIPVTD